MLIHELPADIIITLLCICDLKDVIKLEETCRTFRALVQTHQVWLAHLRRLEQAHAPDIPPHLDVQTLKSDELRTIVVRAVQAYENWRNDSFGTKPHERDEYIELQRPAASEFKPWSDPVITPQIYACRIKIAPGGDYLFVQWDHGFVQMIDTVSRKAMWTYPDPEVPREDRLHVQNFDVDFISNGSANVLLPSLDDEQYWLAEYVDYRTLEVFHIDKAHLGPTRLYSRREKQDAFPIAQYTAIQGDFLAVLYVSESHTRPRRPSLIMADFVANREVFAEVPYSDFLPRILIVREHLFISPTCAKYSYSSYSTLRVLDLRHLFPALLENRRLSLVSTLIHIDELGFTDLDIQVPPGYEVDQITLPSLCSFHWKEERRFDQLSIQISVTPADSSAREKWIVNRYAFTPRQSNTVPPTMTLIASTGIIPTHFSEERHVFTCVVDRLTMSGRFIMKYTEYYGSSKDQLFLSMIDDSNMEAEGHLSFSMRAAPEWLNRAQGEQFILDYLSGAIVYKDRRQSHIGIFYPA